MSVALLRAALGLAGLAGLWATGVSLIGPAVVVEQPRPPAAPTAHPAGGDGFMLTDELLQRAFQRPAFRADRRPASTGYDPARALAPEAAAAPAEPRPVLALSGIVWGEDPAAVVEGVPGAEGSVVFRRGDAVAGLRLVGITEERVVIGGRDTTWQLRVREPWP